jgi:hypothetical protein
MDRMFEFEIPHKGIVLVLEKLPPMELDKFAFEYYGKGEAYNLLVDRTEKIKKEAETLTDFSGYGVKLASIQRERALMTLDLYQSLMKSLRERVRKTFVKGEEGKLNAGSEEGWREVFNIQNKEDVQFLMNLASAFIKVHQPSVELTKNSDRVSESS